LWYVGICCQPKARRERWEIKYILIYFDRRRLIVAKNIIDGIKNKYYIMSIINYLRSCYNQISFVLQYNIILYILYCCSSACGNRFRNIYSYRVARLYSSSTTYCECFHNKRIIGEMNIIYILTTILLWTTTSRTV